MKSPMISPICCPLNPWFWPMSSQSNSARAATGMKLGCQRHASTLATSRTLLTPVVNIASHKPQRSHHNRRFQLLRHGTLLHSAHNHQRCNNADSQSTYKEGTARLMFALMNA
jgi:hypothetical protein